MTPEGAKYMARVGALLERPDYAALSDEHDRLWHVWAAHIRHDCPVCRGGPPCPEAARLKAAADAVAAQVEMIWDEAYPDPNPEPRR